MLDYAWIIPLIPAASFFLILFFGKRLPRKGSEIGIAAVGIAFVLAIATNVQWFDHVDNPEHESESHAEEVVEEEDTASAPSPARRCTWRGGRALDEQEDEDRDRVEPVPEVDLVRERRGRHRGRHAARRPAVMMLLVVTLVSLLVHVYSTDYVAGDRRYTHFFAFLSLFTASMLGLVIAKTTLQLIVCGSWWASAPSSSSATGGRRRPTATPPSRPSSPTGWATWACSSA